MLIFFPNPKIIVCFLVYIFRIFKRFSTTSFALSFILVGVNKFEKKKYFGGHCVESSNFTL